MRVVVIGEGTSDVNTFDPDTEGALVVLIRRALSELIGREIEPGKEVFGEILATRGRAIGRNSRKGFAAQVQRAITNLAIRRAPEEKPASAIVVVLDRDGNTGKLAQLREGRSVKSDEPAVSALADHTAVGVAIEELEAWLLADPAALAEVLRVRRTFADPEALRRPKEELRSLAADHGGGSRLDALATAVQLDRLARACPAFSELRAEISARCKGA
jgi:hypothetical protein